MNFIDSCENYLERLFPFNDIKETSITDNLLLLGIPPYDDIIIELEKEIENGAEAFFYDLNRSILKGEYCDFSSFNEKLIKLNEKLNIITEKLWEKTTQNILFNKIIEYLINPLINALGLYNEFYTFFSEKVLNRKDVVLINVFEDLDNDKLFLKSSSKMIFNIEFFKLNLRVSVFDILLSTNNDILNNLNTIKQKLENHKSPLKLLIVKKIDFLVYKIVLRLKLEENLDVIKISNFEKFEITHDYIFDVFGKYSKYYTGDSIKIREGIGHINLSKLVEEIQTLEILEIHKAIKYIKDVHSIDDIPDAIKYLKLIREEILRRIKNLDPLTFNKKAFELIINYIENNIFSLETDLSNYNFLDIKKKYEKIIDIQIASNTTNFFPYSKILQYIDKRLVYFNSQSLSESFNNEAHEMVEFENSIFDNFKKAYKITTSKYNYIFQLPYEECLVNTNIDSNLDEIFIYSSFLLPFPLNSLNESVNELHQKIAIHKESIKIYKTVGNKIMELDKLSSELKDLRSKEYRTLEVLGIFAAVISFVTASIPAYSFINSASEAFFFCLSLGASLSWFVFLLIYSNGDSPRLNGIRKHFYISLLFLILFWVIFIFIQNYHNIITHILYFLKYI